MRALAVTLACLAGLSLPMPAAYAQGDFWALQRRVVDLFREHAGAVVRVKAAYRGGVDVDKPQVVIGSGFFISREGLVLTNASIVYNPDRVWIEHEGIAYAARVLGEDTASNIALLKTESLPARFSFIHLSDSARLPDPGTFVIRLSAPLEFDPSPSLGIVTGQESRFAQRFFPCAYIRTSIPATPGDGGAAFLDLSGQLVGIQVGSLPDIGATYVLPSRAALRIRDDLIFSGKVNYGWIGFEVREERTVAEGNRLILSLILPGTPAESAGMLPNDVLRQIGEYPIRTIDDLRNAMFYSRVDQFVAVKVQRGPDALDFNVRLAARPITEPILTPVTPEMDPSPAAAAGPAEDSLQDPAPPTAPRWETPGRAD